MTTKELTALARKVYGDEVTVAHYLDSSMVEPGYNAEVSVPVRGVYRSRLMVWGETASIARERLAVCLRALGGGE